MKIPGEVRGRSRVMGTKHRGRGAPDFVPDNERREVVAPALQAEPSRWITGIRWTCERPRVSR